MDYSIEELENALEASVTLQSHYAKLLNQYDLGERMSFSNAGEWIARLRELKQSKKQDPRSPTLRADGTTVAGNLTCKLVEDDRPKACDKLDHDISRSRFVGYKFCPDCGERLSSELERG